MSDANSEAALIQSLFAPLTLGVPGSYGLRDDVAFLQPTPLGLIVTQDQIIEGTHFLADDPLDKIAKRLVRRNLSDMIGKGAIPTAAFLSLAWPKSRDRSGLKAFARGLGEDLDQLCGNCPLMGGDTSETQGHLVASLTMIGTPSARNGLPVLRSGAQVGDVVAVTGVIGDSWLGLQARLGKLAPEQFEKCVAVSMAPSPPDLAIARSIGRFANASIDVSDGLIKDCAHIGDASGVSVTIDLERMPLSQEARSFCGVDRNLERLLKLASGGDDYQMLVTLAGEDVEAYCRAGEQLGVAITCVGTCHQGRGVSLNYYAKPVEMPYETGWQI